MNLSLNLLSKTQVPSQFDCCEAIEEENLKKLIIKPQNILIMADVNNNGDNTSSSSYRYHPPTKFIPTTPPIRRNKNTDLDFDGYDKTDTKCIGSFTPDELDLLGKNLHLLPTFGNHSLMGTPLNRTPTTATSTGLTTKPLFNYNDEPFVLQNAHTRQRSMPVTMPSFKTNTDQSCIEPGSSYESKPNCQIHTMSQDSTKHGSLNLVIDIHLHGPTETNQPNRMTQSFIQDSVDNDHRLINSRRHSSIDDLVSIVNKQVTLSPKSVETILLDHHHPPPVHPSLNRHELNEILTNDGGDSYQLIQQPNKLSTNTLNKQKIDNFHMRSDSKYNPYTDINENLYKYDRVQKKIKLLNSQTGNGWIKNGHWIQQHHYQKQQHQCDNRAQTPIPKQKDLLFGDAKYASVNHVNQDQLSTLNTITSIRESSMPCGFATFSQSVDIPRLIRLLQSQNPQIVSNATAYLQHIVYQNACLKEKTWQCGGIPALVQLLYSDHAKICLNAVCVLRNLTCGDTINIKKELERVGGVRALAWLIENRQIYTSIINKIENATCFNRTQQTIIKDGDHGDDAVDDIDDDLLETVQSVLENAAAVLCNLSLIDCLKRSVLQEALIPSLVNVIVRPVATELINNNISNNNNNSGNELAVNSKLFRNVAAVIRNISSSDDDDVRDQMRQCPYLTSSLFTVLHYAIDNKYQDTKSVELCTCAIRNLCYGIKRYNSTVETQQTKPKIKSNRRAGSLLRIKNSTFTFRRTKKAVETEDAMSIRLGSSANYVVTILESGSIKTIVTLLQISSNFHTLEAAAGTLQNLTAGSDVLSRCVREKIRINHGLPILVELLNVPMNSLSYTAASALRNCILDDFNCNLLAKYAMGCIIQALGYHTCGTYADLHCIETNPEWQLPMQNNSFDRCQPFYQWSNKKQFNHQQEIQSNRKDESKQCIVALLKLCCILIHKKLDHAKRFVTLGGVERCQHLLRHFEQISLRNSEYSVEIVLHLTRQLLYTLWQFSELRPIYKLAGWSEKDFCIIKRSRLAGLVGRRSKTNNLPKPNTNYTTVERNNKTNNNESGPHQMCYIPIKKVDDMSNFNEFDYSLIDDQHQLGNQSFVKDFHESDHCDIGDYDNIHKNKTLPTHYIYPQENGINKNEIKRSATYTDYDFGKNPDTSDMVTLVKSLPINHIKSADGNGDHDDANVIKLQEHGANSWV